MYLVRTMSPDSAKISVLIIVAIISNIKYLSTAQSFGAHPVLFNRRILLYPNNLYTWPKPASVHCCSNLNPELIQRPEANRLSYFDSTSYAIEGMESRFDYSKNLAQLNPRIIVPTMQRAPLITLPWLTKQRATDYNYWSGIKNRFLLRSYSTENLMKNNQIENNLKYTQNLYLSTTGHFIKSETTEKYYVSVNPLMIFDDSTNTESESEDNLRDGFSLTDTSATVYGEEIRHSTAVNEPQPIERHINIDTTTLSPEIETTTVKYLLQNKSITNNEDLHLYKVEISPKEFRTKNKTSPPVSNVTLPDELNSTLEQINEIDVLDKFLHSLDDLERTFYLSTFTKLSMNGPPEKAENGISFVQSGLLLHLMLTALTSTVDSSTRAEIEACNNFPVTEEEKMLALRLVTAWMPKSHSALRFRWSSRLLLGPNVNVSEEFLTGTAAELHMLVDTLNTTSDSELLMNTLNHMIEVDSGGAMRDTFDEEDFSQGVHNVVLSTMYVRGNWRSAPTLLDGLFPFYDSDNPEQLTRMIRINDVVKYADLTDWDAEAVEISYATPGLSLLVLVPRGRSLRALARRVAAAGVRRLPAAMSARRIGVSMPLYTLRMTLLLPNKLHDMGITRLMSAPDGNDTTITLKVSHAVQRLMFWSEAGRNAFKDDGIEWDIVPEMEMVLNRPYLFFVRWLNVTLMNGHFVL